MEFVRTDLSFLVVSPLAGTHGFLSEPRRGQL
jgi:hypothetical protein